MGIDIPTLERVTVCYLPRTLLELVQLVGRVCRSPDLPGRADIVFASSMLAFDYSGWKEDLTWRNKLYDHSRVCCVVCAPSSVCQRELICSMVSCIYIARYTTMYFADSSILLSSR